MTQSMTGYGKGEALVGTKKITVEIRSLNSKQLDMSIKSPAVFREREQYVRSEVSRRLQRGKVDVYVTVENTKAEAALPINIPVFKTFYAQLSELSRELNLPVEPLIGTIMRMPEVMQIGERNEIGDDELMAFGVAVDLAIDNIENFRKTEGAVLMGDLLGRVALIETLLEEIVPYERERVETVKNRIRENLESLNIPLDSNRLEQELIFYIEKLDVTEEKTRLNNHCKYFAEVATSEEFAGRKLGFITQEMGREINTLGSKANHAQIQKIVVRMKDELEKIKEQLLNIL